MEINIVSVAGGLIAVVVYVILILMIVRLSVSFQQSAEDEDIPMTIYHGILFTIAMLIFFS